ncbi:MAG: WYL domain-containing protein [Nocardioidaceae bacterium]
MTQKKSERLMNLMVMLLVSRHHLTKAQIRESLEDYRALSDVAFEKTFERDKEELKKFGIPLELSKLDEAFADDVGYRVSRGAYELPAIEFTAEEVALIAVAANAWSSNELCETSATALRKLRSAGVPIQLGQLADLQSEVPADEPAFVHVWQATDARSAITFDYQRPGSVPERRTVEPWRMFSLHGRWYVVGHDKTRGEARVFRLSRILGEVIPDKRHGTYTLPPESVIDEATRRLAPQSTIGVASVLARTGAANSLRRSAKAIEESVYEDEIGSWDRLTLPYAQEEAFISEILAQGDRVILEAPQALRDEVIGRLDQIAEEKTS